MDGSRHCKCGGFFQRAGGNLVSDSAIEAISGGSEYQVPHYAAPDISRRELAAPSGVRYLRKPDENEGRSHGAIGPRAFVMPLMDVDQMNLGPRFSARTHFKLPHLDSNQDKGFQRPVCCHYTMGESWAFGPQVFIYTILSVFTERLRHVASRIVCFPRTNTHVIRRTGSLDRGARGRCRTVRRPSRPPNTARMALASSGAIDRTVKPSQRFSSGIGTVSVSTTSRAPQFLSRSTAGPESTPCVATTVTDWLPRPAARGMRPRWYRRCRSGHRQARSPCRQRRRPHGWRPPGSGG